MKRWTPILRTLSFALAAGAGATVVAQTTHSFSDPTQNHPDFRADPRVAITVPDRAIENSFRIATDQLVELRRGAYAHYKHDGWLSVSSGKVGPQAGFDPRDFRFGPKCAAYLWGNQSGLMFRMGTNIFFGEHGPDGELLHDYSRHQSAIHVAQVAKHFSDYLRYSGQDQFIGDNWDRLLTIIRWTLGEYDRNTDGLIENGRRLQNRLWAYLVGEPENSFILDQAENDVVVVPSMEVCEWLQLTAAYGKARHLPRADWLESKRGQMLHAIENQAYDRDAGYYYLLYRAKEQKWYHSGSGIDETSRELDVTPYYAAFVSGNDSRGRKVADYARQVLMNDAVFPMPLTYPVYYWECTNYPFQGFIPGGCWEEAYYNCVRAFSKYDMLDPVYRAVKLRSDSIAREGVCMEWYSLKDGIGGGRDRYGISAAGHVSAIIEGLFGITPAGFGFGKVNIWPAIPSDWAGTPATITVTLPDNGFLTYTYLYRPEAKTVTFTVETDRQREGRFRIPVPGRVKALPYPVSTPFSSPPSSIHWNGKETWPNIRKQTDGRREVVCFDQPFTKAVLTIDLE